ncbi:uncharacterized protein B0H18DRAFT_1124265 [Fomitopsis serialis]|uniref:uncharacterized protein n=1 Tax=Fomitopsis serialis TaxID=139415 RepID=UPI002008E28A|nr:uncharacterized protein B0H18DRAFT_1124265 [Neoantrodia serialis]KAH9916360.1 hypothetical protein B0H18DRAFT_1124265 [Neoantrodia serialis]
MSSIRYVHGRDPHIVADPGSDDRHVIDYAHHYRLSSKDTPTISDLWEGDTEGASLSPPSSASGPTFSPEPGEKGLYEDIAELGNTIKQWHLADKIFGALLEKDGFPWLFNTIISHDNITIQDWQETRAFLEDHTLLLRYLSFAYDPAMRKLDVFGPSNLHQVVTNSMTKAVSSTVQPSSAQVVLMDGARALINDNVGYIPDAVMTIGVTKKLSTNDPINVTLDTFVTETSYTQTLKKMLKKLLIAMVKQGEGPLLFTGINIDELDYIDPTKDNSKPDDKGFVAGGGEENDVLCTGWKRGDEVLVGRLKGQWFVFIPEDRDGLQEALDTYTVIDDWMKWFYCVPIQHEYPEGSDVAAVRDAVVKKYRGAIRNIREEAHNQRLHALLLEAIKKRKADLVASLRRQLLETPDFFDPPIPDPIPSFVNDIWGGARHMVEDIFNGRGYRANDSNSNAPRGAAKRAALLEVADSLKRQLEEDEKAGDAEIIDSFCKKQRMNTPPPPVHLQEGASQETLIGDKGHSDDSANSSFDSQGSGESAGSAFDLNLALADFRSLATSRETRSDTRGASRGASRGTSRGASRERQGNVEGSIEGNIGE